MFSIINVGTIEIKKNIIIVSLNAETVNSIAAATTVLQLWNSKVSAVCDKPTRWCAT